MTDNLQSQQSSLSTNKSIWSSSNHEAYMSSSIESNASDLNLGLQTSLTAGSKPSMSDQTQMSGSMTWRAPRRGLLMRFDESLICETIYSIGSNSEKNAARSDADSQTSRLSERLNQSQSRTIRLSFRSVFPYIMVVLLFVALPLANLIYLIVRRVNVSTIVAQERALHTGSLLVDETTIDYYVGKTIKWSGATESVIFGLLLASLVSTAAVLTVGPLMSVFAYSQAQRWLETSEQHHHEYSHGPAIPTIVELSLILKLIQTSDFLTVYHALRYRMRHSTSLIFRETFHFSFLVKIIICCIILADVWLHATSEVISYHVLNPVSGHANLDFGVQINKTRCPSPGFVFTTLPLHTGYPMTLEDSQRVGSNCLTYYYRGDDSPPFGQTRHILEESISAMRGASRQWEVIITGDQAVIVPSELSRKNVHQSIFDTFGLSATCRIPGYHYYHHYHHYPPFVAGQRVTWETNITSFRTPYTIHSSNESVSLLYDPLIMDLREDWELGTGHRFGVFTKLVLSPLDPFDLGAGKPLKWGVSPFGGGGKEMWFSVASDRSEKADYHFISILNNRSPHEPVSHAYLSVCNITVHHTTMEYFNRTYSILHSVVADFETTSALSGGFGTFVSKHFLLPYLSTNLGNLTSPELFAVDFRNSLLQGALGLSAGLLERKPARNVTELATQLASKYPLGPFITLFSLLLLYATIWIITIIRASLCPGKVLVTQDGNGKSKHIHLLEQAHRRLTDPLFVIADLATLTDSEARNGNLRALLSNAVEF